MAHRSTVAQVRRDRSGNLHTLLTFQLPMLYWAVVFAIAALVFGLLGFSGLARGFAAIARFLLALFLILFLIFLILGGFHAVR